MQTFHMAIVWLSSQKANSCETVYINWHRISAKIPGYVPIEL